MTNDKPFGPNSANESLTPPRTRNSRLRPVARLAAARHAPWLLTALCCLGAEYAAAAPPSREEVQATLARPVLEPGQPLVEMRAFIEPRIAAFTPPADLSQMLRVKEDLARLRQRVLDEIVFRGPTAQQWRRAETAVEWLDARPMPGYSIVKLRYEVIPGLWVPALFYLPELPPGEKRPAVLNLGGHEAEGMVKDYKQVRSINLAKRGYAALNVEWFGMGQLRTDGFNHYRMNQLDLCGESGFALFYLAMSRALDLLAAHERVEPKQIAVTGLSGGGLQTIYLAALDERVAAANPVAGYCSLRSAIAYDDLGDSEHVPSDFATLADFTHLTAMVAPRPLLLTYNATDDCCFQAAHSLPALLAAGRPLGHVQVQVNTDPGTHNYDRENREAFYNFVRWELPILPQETLPPARNLGELVRGFEDAIETAVVLGVQMVRSPWEELPVDGEILSPEELHVPLPADNLDLNRTALRLAQSLPRERAPAGDAKQLAAWQSRQRARLAKQLRFTAAVQPEREEERVLRWETLPGGTESLHIVTPYDGAWSVPQTALGFSWKENAADEVVQVLLADAGRASLVDEAHELLSRGEAVVAFDPLLVGESQMTGGDPWYLHALHVAVVGERPLAIQAGQIQKVSGLGDAHKKSPVLIRAHGPRMGIAALVAAALAPPAPNRRDEIHLWDCPATLKQLIEDNVGADRMPELFAFGLLAEFDVYELAALAAPRRVVFHNAGERHRNELGPLYQTYRTLGVNHDPLPTASRK